MWLATEATATAGVMPMKIKSGVIRKPPPIPNMPGDEADRRAHRQHQEDVDRKIGDREIELHRRTTLRRKRIDCRVPQ
ncbi:hypothetical protein ACVWW4_004635 [Bradyrhizobium sp. LB7.1]